MIYAHQCSYCSKIFYTFSTDKARAAQTLYEGIKQHLIDYNEDEKEHKFDDLPEVDINMVYAEMVESNEPPAGGYEL